MWKESKGKAYSREELFELVWSKPMSQLAMDFGISDVALAKKCKKLGIPRPSRGYWRRVECGWKGKRPVLPPRKPNQQEVVWIERCDHADVEPRMLEQKILDEIEQLKLLKNKITVRNDFRGAHRLVSATRSVLRKAKNDDYGRVWAQQDCLNVRVGRSSIDRALLILDAIITALETHDFEIILHDRKQRHGTYLRRNDVELSLGVFERANQRKRKISPNEKRYSWTNDYVYEYEPSGEIEITLNRWPLHERHWKDLKSGPLEERITEIVVEIIESSELVRVELAAREEKRQREIEERREAEELKRLQEEEDKRCQELIQQALAWETATKVRSYLASCEQKFDYVNLSEWLKWGYDHADRVDPIKNGSLIKLIQRVEDNQKDVVKEPQTKF